jgi:thiosulfate/3-mercaptopyruvate sulfurtransferase
MALPPVVTPEELLPMLEETLLVDCRSGPDGDALYRRSHLRGAVHAHLDRDLAGEASHPERGGRHPLPPIETWAATLGRLGIDPRTNVVLYDDKGGANAAARAWWMLRAVGHRNVAVLDGGFDAALAAGIPAVDRAPTIEHKPSYPIPASWQLPTMSIEEVEHIRRDEGWRLVDVRAADRYRGENETLDPIAGHIPGAYNVPLTNNLGTEGRFRSPSDLAALYRELGVAPDRIVVSCGSGVTACHTLLALDRAGMPGAMLFVGSFSEWCRTRDVARGKERG